jgi:serine/threonine protein kinase
VCVNRDLNPNNVLVFETEYETLNVKVADFGLSRVVEHDTSVTGTCLPQLLVAARCSPCSRAPADVLSAGFVGSPSYIAPEVLSDAARYDAKADVYSFGILMWSVLQYLYLTYINIQPRTTPDHLTLMRPYESTSQTVAWCCPGTCQPLCLYFLRRWYRLCLCVSLLCGAAFRM